MGTIFAYFRNTKHSSIVYMNDPTIFLHSIPREACKPNRHSPQLCLPNNRICGATRSMNDDHPKVSEVFNVKVTVSRCTAGQKGMSLSMSHLSHGENEAYPRPPCPKSASICIDGPLIFVHAAGLGE